MSQDLPLPFKNDVADQLLRKGSVFIHLDPRLDDVVVPPWLRHQAQLVLQIGYDMPIPIDDLDVGDDGIFATLSFSRTPFTCKLPWKSVFALVGEDGKGMVWPESMPPEIEAEVAREKELSRNRESSFVGGSLQAKKDVGRTRTRSGKPLPPYLRVIK